VLDEGWNAYVDEDYMTAVEKLKPLAINGNIQAQYYLGLVYYHGEEGRMLYFYIPKSEDEVPILGHDNKTAIKWFRLAADQGHEEAQYKLGEMYFYGYGYISDYKEAVKWYRLSAEQGHSSAQEMLGVMYKNGKGVTTDYVKAHKWFNIAGASQNSSARRDREKIEKFMTHGQITEAHKLAREWMEKRTFK